MQPRPLLQFQQGGERRLGRDSPAPPRRSAGAWCTTNRRGARQGCRGLDQKVSMQYVVAHCITQQQCFDSDGYEEVKPFAPLPLFISSLLKGQTAFFPQYGVNGDNSQTMSADHHLLTHPDTDFHKTIH